MKQVLKDGGATREFYISDLVTHVIAVDTDFSQHQETTEFSLPVVKVDDMYMYNHAYIHHMCLLY